MYRQYYGMDGKTIVGVFKDENMAIPFDPANTDYQNFKIQVADGTPLEDANGVLMTQQQVDDFLKTIP